MKVNYVKYGRQHPGAMTKLVDMKSFETHRDVALKAHA